MRLGLRQLGRQVFGGGQAAQRHQAVGFHFQQALNDAARAGFGGVGRSQHQHALKTASAQAEIGQHHGMALVAHQRSRQRVLTQTGPKPLQQGLRLRQIGRQQGQFDGAKGAPRHLCQPALGQQALQLPLLAFKPASGLGLHGQHQRIARELAVALPLQGVAGQRQTQKIVLQVGQPELLLTG